MMIFAFPIPRDRLSYKYDSTRWVAQTCVVVMSASNYFLMECGSSTKFLQLSADSLIADMHTTRVCANLREFTIPARS
jgi:hypothetical protein